MKKINKQNKTKQIPKNKKTHDGHRLHSRKGEFIVARNVDLDNRVLGLVGVGVAAEEVDGVAAARHSRMVGIAICPLDRVEFGPLTREHAVSVYVACLRDGQGGGRAGGPGA